VTTDPEANLPRRGPQSRDLAAEMMGGAISGRQVQNAKLIQREAPDLFDALGRSEITVNAALKEIENRRRVAEGMPPLSRNDRRVRLAQNELRKAVERIDRLFEREVAASPEMWVDLLGQMRDAGPKLEILTSALADAVDSFDDVTDS
jgi:hypothetical protein